MTLSFDDAARGFDVDAEITVEELQRTMQLQRSLLDAASGVDAARQRIAHACRLFERAAPGAVASVMILDANGSLQVFSAPSIPSIIADQFNDLTPGPGSGSCGNAIYREEPVYVSDAQADQRWEKLRALAVRCQMKACWSTPIRDTLQQIVGTFSLTRFEPGVPTAYERKLLDLGASVFGLLLQQQREEIRRQAHEDYTRRLALVASQTTNGVIIMNPDGDTVWVNAGMQRMSGYTAQELIGRHPSDVLQGPQTDRNTSAFIRESIQTHQGFEVTNLNYTKSGQPYWVHTACSPIYRADGSFEGLISIEADVTPLRRLADFNALHAAVNQVVASGDNVSLLPQSICDLAAHHADLALAWIGKPDESDCFQFLAISGDSRAYLDSIHISSNPDIPEGQGSSGRAWREHKPYYNQSYGTIDFLAPWHDRASRFGLQASATEPIFRDGKVWAIFNVYHAHAGVFDLELQVLLEALAHDISRGLDSIDLLTRERKLAAAQKQLAEQLHQEKELAQITLASVGDAVITADIAGHVTFLNPIAENLTGWPSSLAVGRPITDVFLTINEATRERTMSPVEMALKSGKIIKAASHPILIARSGAEFMIEDSAAPIFSQTGALQGCVLVFRDVTEKHEAQKRLRWQAAHDPLTGLPNRYALELHLRSSIDRAYRNGTKIAVGLLDLDEFKPLNDAYGHAMGDLLLQQLGRRLREQLSEPDMLARLGGDELVVVFDNIPQNSGSHSLEAALARLHEAVDAPFELAPAINVRLGMSMGIAFYPTDAQDGDGLLRQADAAMYASKSNKFNRNQWWTFATTAAPVQMDDEPINGYGEVAASLLRKAGEHWGHLGPEFVDSFYDKLQAQPHSSRVLSFLLPSELIHLKARQADHLSRLVDPHLTPEEHDVIAIRLGKVHAMIGVESSDVMAAMNEYGNLLHRATQKLPWRMDARLALRTILHARVGRELQIQSRGRDHVEQERRAHLATLEAGIPCWVQSGDFPERLVKHLSTLASIRGVGFGRADTHDHYVLEFGAGCIARYLTQAHRHRAGRNLETEDKFKHGASRRAWLAGQICVCNSEALETACDAPAIITRRFRIRSSAAIPILDAFGHPMVIITLLGAYPGQFESPSMRIWLESIQHLVTPVLQRLERGLRSNPIDASTRQHLHALLFEDNLQIVVQPLMRLASGAVDKVEVLARLRDGERLLNPGMFLPAFGQQDLQVLFRKGLHQILAWLVRWDEQGLRVDASINLPPSVLVSTDCPRWIEDELKAAAVEPSRLYLELLETEDDTFDTRRRDAALTQLAVLGVRLVMDDLGSGYSSLQRLRSLPFHTVKIDQELVKHALADPDRTVPFIGSLVRMARALDLCVVIEGLETDELVEMAACLGADYGQGFALAKPLLPQEFMDWINDVQRPTRLREPTSTLGRLALLTNAPAA